MIASRTVVLASTVAFLVCACASPPPSQDSEQPAVQLSEVLLDEDALGGGWQQTETSEKPQDDSHLQVCGQEVETTEGASAEALRAFQQGINVLGHALGTFEHEDDARKPIDDIREAASQCTEWTDDDGLNWTLEPIDGIDPGDDVVAIRMTTSGGVEAEQRLKLTVGYTTDYVVWRKGRVISVIAHAYAEASPQFVVDMYEAVNERLERTGYS